MVKLTVKKLAELSMLLKTFARKGKVDQLQRLLQMGADAEFETVGGNTALFEVSTAEAAKVLVEEGGADINHKNDRLSTPLMFAATAGNLDVTTYLLRMGATVDARDTNGSTALIGAANNGELEVCQALLDYGASKSIKSYKKMTAYDYAERADEPEVMVLLANYKTKKPVAAAAAGVSTTSPQQEDNSEIGKSASGLVSGDQREGGSCSSSASSPAREEETAVKFEAKSEEKEQKEEAVATVKVIKKTPKIKSETKSSTNVKTHVTAKSEQKAKAKRESISSTSSNDKRGVSSDDEVNDSPYDQLLAAMKTGRVEKLRKLLDAGVHVDAVGQGGRTALFSARTTDIAKVLIDRGANLDHSRKTGATPLVNAVRKDREDIARLLIEAHASVHIVDKRGYSALYCASEKGFDMIVRMLLDRGVDIAHKCEDGLTALDIAQKNKHHTVVALLAHALLNKAHNAQQELAKAIDKMAVMEARALVAEKRETASQARIAELEKQCTGSGVGPHEVPEYERGSPVDGMLDITRGVSRQVSDSSVVSEDVPLEDRAGDEGLSVLRKRARTAEAKVVELEAVIKKQKLVIAQLNESM